jgi:hypothetical protein
MALLIRFSLNTATIPFQNRIYYSLEDSKVSDHFQPFFFIPLSFLTELILARNQWEIGRALPPAKDRGEKSEKPPSVARFIRGNKGHNWIKQEHHSRNIG